MVSVILTRVKYPHNLAAAIRACACFGVEALYYTGARFAFEAGERLPREERMKGYASVTFEATERPFDRLAAGTRVVGVEVAPGAMPLAGFWHSTTRSMAYVFGPEDGGLDKATRGLCHEFVYIPARHCLNLAAALNVVLAHRWMQRGNLASPAEAEGRGEVDVPGWEGK